MDRSAFGNRSGSRFRLKSAPRIASAGTLRKSQLAVTKIVDDIPDPGETSPVPLEDAFLVHVMEQGDLSRDLHIDPRSILPTMLAPEVNVLTGTSIQVEGRFSPMATVGELLGGRFV